MFDGYNEHNSVRFGGYTFTLGINLAEAMPYLVTTAKPSKELGIREYTDCVASADYLEVFRLFAERLTAHLDAFEAEKLAYSPDNAMLTADSCIPDGLKEHLQGKLIVIKPERFSPEYRSATHQIVYSFGGFGCCPTARGSAVFCKSLIDGEITRFERCDVMGILDPEKAPAWVKDKLAALLAPQGK